MIKFVYSVAIGFFLLALFLYFLPINSINDRISPKALFLLGIVIIVILRLIGNQHFEYDSDGETLNFKSRDAFISAYSNVFIRSSEFPKKKLVSYKIFGFPRKLDLLIKSKRSKSGITKLSYKIAFLNRTEINDLRRSLRKVVEENKSNEQVKTTQQKPEEIYNRE